MRKFLLLSDTFPPHRTSAANQLKDLCNEFARRGHDVTVISTGGENSLGDAQLGVDGSVRVLRIKSSRFSRNYVKRLLAEAVLPLRMYLLIRKVRLLNKGLDCLIWYSPSIFVGIVAAFLKKKYIPVRYLILRDMFPQWAVDLGLMKRNGLVYLVLEFVNKLQFRYADIIAVQSSASLTYFKSRHPKYSPKVVVLENWLSLYSDSNGDLSGMPEALFNRPYLIYAGNVGVAQDIEPFLKILPRLKQLNLNLVIIGRGTDFKKFQAHYGQLYRENVFFIPEVEESILAELYHHSMAGLVSLNLKHSTHNVPGKFISYLKYGVPVIAKINIGNTLARTIVENRLGVVTHEDSESAIVNLIERFLMEFSTESQIRQRCQQYFNVNYSVENCVEKVLHSISNVEVG